jgi:hypothetical protein
MKDRKQVSVHYGRPAWKEATLRDFYKKRGTSLERKLREYSEAKRLPLARIAEQMATDTAALTHYANGDPIIARDGTPGGGVMVHRDTIRKWLAAAQPATPAE